MEGESVFTNHGKEVLGVRGVLLVEGVHLLHKCLRIHAENFFRGLSNIHSDGRAMFFLKTTWDFKGVHIKLTTLAESKYLRAVVLGFPAGEDGSGLVYLAKGIENMLFCREVLMEKGMEARTSPRTSPSKVQYMLEKPCMSKVEWEKEVELRKILSLAPSEEFMDILEEAVVGITSDPLKGGNGPLRL